MDTLDQEILQALAADARVPLSRIAKDLGVANATVHQRFQRLRDKGILQGFRISLDFDKIGLPVSALISLSLLNDAVKCDAADELKRNPFIQSCASVTGEFDLLMTIRARSSEHLGTILDDIRSLAHGNTRTLVVLSTHFEADHGALLKTLDAGDN